MNNFSNSLISYSGRMCFSLMMEGVPKKPVLGVATIIGSGTALYLLNPQTRIRQAATILGASLMASLMTEGIYRAAAKARREALSYLLAHAFKNLQGNFPPLSEEEKNEWHDLLDGLTGSVDLIQPLDIYSEKERDFY